MKRLMTHRGFTVSAGRERDEYIEYPIVDKLYSRMETSHDWGEDFAYLKDVVIAAKQTLFSPSGRFLLLEQLKHPSSRWVLSFATSTLKYIETGKARDISIENYRDLMAYHPAEELVSDSDRNQHFSTVIRTHCIDWMRPAAPSRILQRWLSHEDGLTDLVQTMKLFGGSLPENWEDFSEAVS